MTRRPALVAGLADLAVVVVFVAAGRRTHDDTGSITGIATTAAPFIIGLAVGWASASVRRHPGSLRTGMTLWASTLVAGMVVRNVVFGDGTATPFVAVATAFLGGGLLGRRAIGVAVRARRAAGQSSGDLSAR